MKKKLILFFIVFLNIIIYAQTISGKVTYVVSIQPLNEKKLDSSYQARTKKKMDKWMRDILKKTPPVNAYLEFTNNESLYYVEDKMQNDGKSTFNLTRTAAGSDHKYYKNTDTKEYFYENNTGELLLTDIEPRKWKVTQESKNIGGYICFKAIDLSSKKKTTSVWFAPQIPVSFGPKDFNGLPGLVLLVEMKKRTFTASKIVLNPKKKIKIKKPTKGRKETIEEYNKRVDAFMKFLHKKD